MPEVYVVTDSLEQLTEEMRQFPQVAHGAMASSLNRTLNFVTKEITSDVAENYAVKKPQVKKVMKTQKATKRSMTASLTVTDKRLRLGAFKFKPTSPSGNKAKDTSITITIKKGQPKQLSSRDGIPWFVGTANKTTGKPDIFTRTGEGRKISWGFTVSIPQMVSNDEIYNETARKAEDFLTDRYFNHEFPYMLERAQARINRASD